MPWHDDVEVLRAQHEARCQNVDTLPDLPGIGFEGKADLYREMQKLSA